MGLLHSKDFATDEEYLGNLLVGGSMKEDTIRGIKQLMTNQNIACDASLDQDINQEIGFLGEQERVDYFQYEEQKDFLEGNPNA